MRTIGHLLATLAIAVAALATAASEDFPTVVPGRPLVFPDDHGAHPAFRTEWWYVTGWLESADGEPVGFQVTFFRSRQTLGQGNPSRFAPTQLLFAHAAVSDPELGRLMHDQRSARSGFGLAEAAVGDARVHLGDWSLHRGKDGAYRARVAAREFGLDLRLIPGTSPLLQGEAGFSRKGALPAEASYYYSQPQLVVSGTLVRDGRRTAVRGRAWLDHEWSSEYLADGAVGWDWVGLNLDDGGALMAFRIRDAKGETLWAGGTWRRTDGGVETLAPAEVTFRPSRRWRSPRSGALYPVAQRVEAGHLHFDLLPLFDDQELDSRASTGAIYWEGAVEARQDGRRIGRGYLELTGYHRPLRLTR